MARRRRRSPSRDRSYDGWGYEPYVPVAERRLLAARKVKALAATGRDVEPVVLEGRKISNTFWGTAWCENLERYSDFENRLPRGRTYLRNRSVIDLGISPGEVSALVCGSEVYRVSVTVSGIGRLRWQEICRDCAGAIDSLVELLQGRFSKGVMERLCRQETGLFPAPREIRFECTCPDQAYMCKHVAAVLYGIGARLDNKPELLFRLRKVDEQELIAGAAFNVPLGTKATASSKVLQDADLGAVFGVEIVPEPAVSPSRPPAKRKVSPRKPKATR